MDEHLVPEAPLVVEPLAACAAKPDSMLDLESPLWVDAPPLIARSFRQAFDSATSLTVGIEEELLLLDPITFQPANVIEWALERLDGDDRFTCEFWAAQLELNTPPAHTVLGACRELASARSYALEQLAGSVRLAALGTYPYSGCPVEITGRKRYGRIAAEEPWMAWRSVPSGLHVHVALRGSERALAVLNAVRSYMPEIGALAANSPFFEGRDTELASIRMQLLKERPRNGTSPAFATWEELARFLFWGATAGTIPDATHLWWDVRPSMRCGTLEFRVADAQTRVEDSGAIAAVCQALVASLAARHDAGEQLRVHSAHRIEENRTRALRSGIRGHLADLESGRPVSTVERLAVLLTELEPFAEELGCRNELLRAWALLEENGAVRQRRLVTEEGLEALLERLADETEEPARPGLGQPCRERAHTPTSPDIANEEQEIEVEPPRI